MLGTRKHCLDQRSCRVAIVGNCSHTGIDWIHSPFIHQDKRKSGQTKDVVRGGASLRTEAQMKNSLNLFPWTPISAFKWSLLNLGWNGLCSIKAVCVCYLTLSLLEILQFPYWKQLRKNQPNNNILIKKMRNIFSVQLGNGLYFIMERDLITLFPLIYLSYR